MMSVFNTAECSNVLSVIQDLVSGVGKICASPSHIEWTSMKKTFVGKIDTTTAKVQTFKLPDTIPSKAREVLIYAYIKSGWVIVSGECDAKFFTMKNPRTRFEQYLRIVYHRQGAHTVTVDNMWFPLTKDRSLHVSLCHALTGVIEGYAFAIGYR